MTGIQAAFWAEALKIRRSRMLWLSLAAAIFMAVMTGFLMFISKNPELAAEMGLLGTKSSIVQSVDWLSYLGLLSEMISMLGLFGFGFVTSWVFGREYSDRTVKDLLALPIPRSSIVLAKFLAVAGWSLLLALALLASSLAIGWLIGLSGWSATIAVTSVYTYGATALMAFLLCTPVAFLASYGRGFLPPIGFIVIILIVGQFAQALNLGPYFPWTIPGLYSIAASAGAGGVGLISYTIIALTCLGGLAATFAWWRYADHH